jgi:predicted enzyme related to lactoylglutathione lyase
VERSGNADRWYAVSEGFLAPQGAPCWISLLARDLPEAQKFYGGLLGWEFRPGSQRLGPYVLARSGGVAVAGLGAQETGVGIPVSWTVYFAASSADVVAERVRERGATVAVGPVEFGGGRVAWAADPFGAVFGIWQGEVDPGWEIGDKAGAPAWIELRSSDAFASALFYGEVFDWDQRGQRGQRGREHYECRYEHDRVILDIGGRPVAGLVGGADQASSDPMRRPRWHVFFNVEDVPAVCARAAESGGAVVHAPSESPYGTVAALADPQGGIFSVAATG